MAFENPAARTHHDHQQGVLNSRDVDDNGVGAEIGALRAENAELRKIVIALSKLVVRNVLRNDAKP